MYYKILRVIEAKPELFIFHTKTIIMQIMHRSINLMLNNAAKLKVKTSRKDVIFYVIVDLYYKSIDRVFFYCTWIGLSLRAVDERL